MKNNDDVLKMFTGKVINRIDVLKDVLVFEFADSSTMIVKDICNHFSGEIRFLTIDVDLSDFSKAKFITVTDINECHYIEESETEFHQVSSIQVETSFGNFIVTFHNINDGCNNGFNILIDDLYLETYYDY